MSNLFCPKCGEDTDVFFDNVCKQCFTQNRTLVKCAQVLYTRICATCGSLFKRGKWSSGEDEEKTIIECVKGSLEHDPQAHDLKLDIKIKPLDYSRYRVHIDGSGKIKGAPIEIALDTEVRISRETCDTCSRIAGGYFEGIVQIRADKRIPTSEELGKCTQIAEDVASRSRMKGDRLAFIANILELDEGVDYYVGEMKLGKQICRAIIDVYGGKFLESPKLVGQKNGVDLYRITFALRLPEFVKGDIISVGDKVIEVQNCGKHVTGIDLETGKRFMENFNDLIDVKKLGRKQDAIPAVLVANEERTIQVLDPDTYETITIKRPEFLSAEQGNEVKIVKTSKGIFVVP
jgi:nonsense-mediated mRNA decay protein 3